MITDERRRKVAAELRELAANRHYVDEFIAADTVGFYRGEAVEGFDSDSLLEVADLIDSGECENVYDGSVQDSCDNGFLCSVCGCKVEDEEHYRVSGTWNFCPGCGRVVVKR